MSKFANVWGDYQQYKDIKLYPLTMNDYEIFEKTIGLLKIYKQDIPDVRILKMSYLKFLLFIEPYFIKMGKETYNVHQNVYTLFDLVFKNQNWEIKYYDKPTKQDISQDIQHIYEKNAYEMFLMDNLDINRIKINIIIDGKKFTERDFDNIRHMILQQNAVYILDENMNAELRKEIVESQEYFSKLNDNTNATTEEEIIAYHCESHLPYHEIRKLTVFQFRKGLQRYNLIKHYQIYKTASCSGFVEFKEEIPHWLSHIKDNDLDKILMSKEEFDRIAKQIK